MQKDSIAKGRLKVSPEAQSWMTGNRGRQKLHFVIVEEKKY